MSERKQSCCSFSGTFSHLMFSFTYIFVLCTEPLLEHNEIFNSISVEISFYTCCSCQQLLNIFLEGASVGKISNPSPQVNDRGLTALLKMPNFLSAHPHHQVLTLLIHDKYCEFKSTSLHSFVFEENANGTNGEVGRRAPSRVSHGPPLFAPAQALGFVLTHTHTHIEKAERSQGSTVDGYHGFGVQGWKK